jgi:hypothetical protein
MHKASNLALLNIPESIALFSYFFSNVQRQLFASMISMLLARLGLPNDYRRFASFKKN